MALKSLSASIYNGACFIGFRILCNNYVDCLIIARFTSSSLFVFSFSICPVILVYRQYRQNSLDTSLNLVPTTKNELKKDAKTSNSFSYPCIWQCSRGSAPPLSRNDSTLAWQQTSWRAIARGNNVTAVHTGQL